MERTNKKFRNAMGGYEPFKDARIFCKDLLERMGREEVSGPSPPGSGCPVHGPLSSRIAQMDVDNITAQGNAMIFAFAGHVSLSYATPLDLIARVRIPLGIL